MCFAKRRNYVPIYYGATYLPKATHGSNSDNCAVKVEWQCNWNIIRVSGQSIAYTSRPGRTDVLQGVNREFAFSSVAYLE